MLLEYFLLLVLAVLLMTAAWHLGTQFISIIVGAPYVPSSDTRVAMMLRMAKIEPGEHVVDLGSGDGRLVITAAAIGAKAVGFELNPFLTIRSRLTAWRAHQQKNVTFKNKSFMKADLSKYDVVFVYLLPSIMKSLEAKLEAELKPGARVIVNAFPLPGWQPTIMREHVYVYVKQNTNKD